jgi:hypothetical protein
MLRPMSLFGKLEDTPLQEILQVMAASQVTGKLRLTGRDREGIMVFRNGKIVYAASSAARQTLGNLLLLEGLVSEEQLSHALDRQHAAKKEQRLGSILIEMKAIDEETLAEVVQQQTERVVTEFLAWESGYFKLDKLELQDFGEVEVDAREFLMREGLSTDELLSDLQTRIDELQMAGEHGLTAGVSDVASIARRADSLSTLKALMGEIRSPQFTGEITQKILSYANELFSRGVLFVVRQDGFGVMGQFGIPTEEGQTEAKLRQLLIPEDAPTLLRESAGRKEALVEPLEETEWNTKLLEAIGGPAEGDSVAVPLVVNDRVLLVLYGDHLQGDLREGWLEELELLILQAGLAMEKDLLVKRIEHYENLRRQD